MGEGGPRPTWIFSLLIHSPVRTLKIASGDQKGTPKQVTLVLRLQVGQILAISPFSKMNHRAAVIS
jgi:hypothetical protein